MAGSRGREDPGVGPVGRTAAVDALAAAYGNVTAAVDGLGEADLMRPSLCAGWDVADVPYHQLSDARRALADQFPLFG
jgi:Mycothiol maleylpyruvate isomerase N-terminal domain